MLVFALTVITVMFQLCFAEKKSILFYIIVCVISLQVKEPKQSSWSVTPSSTDGRRSKVKIL